MSVQSKALTAITDHAMLPADTTVIVGLSGGADSVTLLHVLLSLRSSLGVKQVIAVHVDHQLRGEEAARDRRFCEELCAGLQVPCHVFRYDVAALAAAAGKGVEEMGRELRYQAFSEVASRFPRSRIATAHTADDNAETLLLHLCRGCGVHGLTGIPFVRGNVIRPLLTCSRADIEAYCREQQLTYVTDSTNTDGAYARNRIRHRVLPVLRSINAAADSAFERLMTQMRETDLYLQRQADTYWPGVLTDSTGVYCRTALLTVDPALRPVLLSRMLKQADIPVDDSHLRQMSDCLHTGGTCSLPRGFSFSAYKDRVYITAAEETENEPPIPLTVDSPLLFAGVGYRARLLSRQEYEQKLNICKLVFKNACDYDMIYGDPVLRKRQEGDRYHPAGRSCGKTLKKLFNEEALFSPLRDRVPILCDEKGIVLVYGFGCDERVRITDATQRILLLEKTEE